VEVGRHDPGGSRQNNPLIAIPVLFLPSTPSSDPIPSGPPAMLQSLRAGELFTTL